LNFNLQRWEGSVWSKVLTVILVLAILGALGMLVYIVAVPHVGETFTEFYLLGYEGKAENYPAQFILDKNRVVNVVYGQSGLKTADDHGQIILGIVNREQKDVSYSVELTIDEQPLNINLDGKNSNRIGPIPLAHEQKWEQRIRFAPLRSGENQKVVFSLYKDGVLAEDNSLHIWISASEQ
jgi:uncharacterized membrane protein